MKKSIILALILMCSTTIAMAQDIKLPAPDLTQPSMTVVEALATRHSVREYSSQPLTDQELSNLCWAAFGVSRDNNHRTAPTAMNRKEIRLYVFTDSNVYEYKPVKNVLKHVVEGDHRGLTASNGNGGFSQAFVKTAPVILVMVIDFQEFGSQNEHAQVVTCVDAGNVSENINLYCQSVGLVTVPRAIMDAAAIRQLLGLSDKQFPVMNNPVGFPKK